MGSISTILTNFHAKKLCIIQGNLTKTDLRKKVPLQVMKTQKDSTGRDVQRHTRGMCGHQIAQSLCVSLISEQVPILGWIDPVTLQEFPVYLQPEIKMWLGSNGGPLARESCALPLDHRTPKNDPFLNKIFLLNCKKLLKHMTAQDPWTTLISCA